ncbi:hypothetical protein GIY23_11455 [Allosaccharopolyspora coralli]|uniref:Uncharacterized protein n=2 Tax=Allosaccharopolyspora coralli TaxID=2665642 RepID=A0A5Q3QA46_9PSEU|nr:hypothetical protein GIY23_11455 [Allosaccharopolyspora coralli]
MLLPVVLADAHQLPTEHGWVGLFAIFAGLALAVVALIRRRRTTLGRRRRLADE